MNGYKKAASTKETSCEEIQLSQGICSGWTGLPGNIKDGRDAMTS